MGRHRKRRPRSRAGRRIALVSAGLLVPVTGGAVVYAATGDTQRPAASSPARGGGSRHHARAAVPAVRPQAAAPTAVPSPSTRPSTASPSPAPPAGPRIRFAPYADVLSWPPPNLAKTHVKDYTMGFVADGGDCSPDWGGLSPVDKAFALNRLKEVPGKVIVSFGGPHATELAQNCDDVDRLVKAYRSVFDDTHPSAVDFYLTDAELTDAASVRRRVEALTSLERDGGPPVSVTLPLHRTGLSGDALGLLRSAAASGLSISIVNFVPADDGDLIASATAAHGQLQRLYRETDAQVWQRMGVTPIIGVAGIGTEFRAPDAQQLVAWAAAHDLGRLSMWSITRDTPCVTGTSITGDTCSGLDEDAGTFTKIFQSF